MMVYFKFWILNFDSSHSKPNFVNINTSTSENQTLPPRAQIISVFIKGQVIKYS